MGGWEIALLLERGEESLTPFPLATPESTPEFSSCFCAGCGDEGAVGDAEEDILVLKMTKSEQERKGIEAESIEDESIEDTRSRARI